MNKIISIIRRGVCVNFSLSYKLILHNLKNNKKVLKFYNNTSMLPTNQSKLVIYIANENFHIGGLADRLRAITTLFQLCKKMNIGFRINFIYPFNLIEYLQPVHYNWSIAEDELSYNIKYSKPLFYCQLHKSISKFLANKFIKSNYKQLHFYTNIKIDDSDYGALFKELFRPANKLQELINFHLNQINGDFISASFRFIGLFGDTDEKNAGSYLPKKPLTDNEKNDLLIRCIDHLKEINAENSHKKIFVATDSPTFLTEAEKLDFIYLIPGEIEHIDISKGSNENAYMKVFLDFFLMAHSKKIYSIVDGLMYRSGFPYYASLYNNIPYIVKRY